MGKQSRPECLGHIVKLVVSHIFAHRVLHFTQEGVVIGLLTVMETAGVLVEAGREISCLLSIPGVVGVVLPHDWRLGGALVQSIVLHQHPQVIPVVISGGPECRMHKLLGALLLVLDRVGEAHMCTWNQLFAGLRRYLGVIDAGADKVLWGHTNGIHFVGVVNWLKS